MYGSKIKDYIFNTRYKVFIYISDSTNVQRGKNGESLRLWNLIIHFCELDEPLRRRTSSCVHSSARSIHDRMMDYDDDKNPFSDEAEPGAAAHNPFDDDGGEGVDTNPFGEDEGEVACDSGTLNIGFRWLLKHLVICIEIC